MERHAAFNRVVATRVKYELHSMSHSFEFYNHHLTSVIITELQIVASIPIYINKTKRLCVLIT